jgi:hypothetical protein
LKLAATHAALSELRALLGNDQVRLVRAQGGGNSMSGKEVNGSAAAGKSAGGNGYSSGAEGGRA